MFKNKRVSSNYKFTFIISAFLITICYIGCQQPAETTLQGNIAVGKELAKVYCVSCHQLPSPALIDRKSWQTGVLPAMAKQLNIKNYMGQYYAEKDAALNIVQWQRIVDYYVNSSPDSLIIPKPKVAPLNDMAIFSVERPKHVNQAMPGMTTFLGFDPANDVLYSGDAANNLYSWDGQLDAKVVARFKSPVTGVDFNTLTPDDAVVTCIGQMAPINVAKGQVIQINLKDRGTIKQTVLTDSLPRSVQTVTADFNKDGLMDFVVCGFGHDHGGLYLLTQQTDHHFKRQAVREIPGGEQLITGDFNNDGWPDVMCLFAQADEGIWMFLNDHKGGFTTQNLLHFPSVYGSSSFQLVDFNHDGKPDILYTCGDNSDFSKVLKPYHGVYIFTNQGNWKFKQTYFYHINGATKAIAADFDHDGDLDIAAIAFFADFKNNPQEGFTYLEQTGLNNYTAHALPINQYGRWLTMTVCDLYHNGNMDIVLGNFSTAGRGLINQKGVMPTWDQHEPIIILKNNSAKK